MADAEALKAEVKKLSAQAMQAKMDLHDLSEELPVGVEKVPQVAQRVVAAYAALAERKAALQALAETAAGTAA
ncbi:MAG TPA: CCE_0567 family metalloprotein [Novosphingobium sp.]|nr:CCE_0567 family metalloprotein [Novosphingobium sp.]HZV08699.1 CCE_0567 family metalloprotein [Novosphingobium sp.]